MVNRDAVRQLSEKSLEPQTPEEQVPVEKAPEETEFDQVLNAKLETADELLKLDHRAPTHFLDREAGEPSEEGSEVEKGAECAEQADEESERDNNEDARDEE